MVYLHKANDVRLLWVTFLAYMHQKVGECRAELSGLCVRLLQCHGSLFWDMSLSVDGGRVQG